VQLKYALIKHLADDYSIRRLCQTLKIHPSDYYAWLSEPKSARAKDDQRLLGLIKHSWLESGGFMAIARSMTCARLAELWPPSGV
jgi:putative transposase